MTKPTVLILGATSDIARAVAHRFAQQGYALQLAARHPERLADDQADLTLRHDAAVSLHKIDVLDTDSHVEFVDSLPVLPDVTICAVGLMADQNTLEQNLSQALQVMRSNYEGPSHILSVLANRCAARGSGVLVGISSVAGDRGRASNYFYGSAKAGFTAFLSGLRGRLSRSDVHVLTVLPGFVDTRMTADLDLPARLTAQPDDVANAIFRAVIRRKNRIYVYSVWRLIMTVICLLPEAFFKRLRF